MIKTINTDVGNDIFQMMRENDYYYIDKSLFIKEFFKNKERVNLITRPRRFGKSLNLSMLQSYCEIGADPALFKGLAIEGEKEIHDAHFGKHPVLHLSFASLMSDTYEKCLRSLSIYFQSLFVEELEYISVSAKLSPISKQRIEKFSNPPDVADEPFLANSLRALTTMLYQHHGEKVVILIDEYDSMLTHALGKGYEKTLCEFLSSFFGKIFKSNRQVEFVVLTGCLRIAKESIFTGANNVNVSTVSHPEYADSFGLTEQEVAHVLDDFGLSDALATFQEWYNGYLFCGRRIYNTCSVMNFCKALIKDRTAAPESYWANSSSNDILRDIIAKSEVEKSLPKLENLLLGGVVDFDLRNDITLNDFNNVSSLWSVLVHSGYLTPCEKGSRKFHIPNKEIHNEFVNKVIEWVKARIGAGVHDDVVQAIYRFG